MIKRFMALVMLCLSIAVVAQAEGLSEYKMSSGDLIKIQVYGEEELTIETRLSDAGTISYPLLGELRVLGMTTGQLSTYITDEPLNGYLLDPSVSVAILQYREFYIDGAVKSPGGYPYQPGLTLQRAVSLAGGFTERASSSKFYRVKEGEDSSRPVKVNLNSPIQPGDVITIEESFF